MQTDVDGVLKAEFAYAAWLVQLRRYSRRYRRGSPADHRKPWAKYAMRGRPSSVAVVKPGAIERLRSYFLPREIPGGIESVISRLFGKVRGHE